MPFVHVEMAILHENKEESQFSTAALQGKLTVPFLKSKIVLKAKICVKIWL